MPHSKKSAPSATFSLIFATGGLLLTETLIAVATLAASAIALGTIITSTISTTIFSRDYLVAEGLFNEADEVVQNIRYTNWLLKPSSADRIKCWLRLAPDNLADSACGTNAVAGFNYIVVLENATGGNGKIWKMKAASADLDLDKTLSTNNNFQIYLDSNTNTPGYLAALNAPSGITISKSKFFRSIKFTNVAADNSEATYTVKLQWKDGAKTRELIKNVTLYNYL